MEIGPEILATLATKDDLKAHPTKADLKSYPTRDDLAAAVATLATKDDLKAYPTRDDLAAVVATLATKDDLAATRAEMFAAIREEGERTRRHFDIVSEQMRESIGVIAEGHATLDRKIDAVAAEAKRDTADLDRRVTRLETRRRPR